MDFGFTGVRDRVRFLYCLIGLFQQSTGVIKKRASSIRQADRLCGAFEQLEPDLIFKIANLPAQRRLGDVKFQCGARDVFRLRRPQRSSADAEAPQRFSITAQDAEARNILFAESGISFCLAKRTSLGYWNFYETHSRNVARRRCAVPDDALDRRLAGREGRFARSCAESARHFLRSLLATALHIPPSSWLFAWGRARYRPGFFRTST